MDGKRLRKGLDMNLKESNQVETYRKTLIRDVCSVGRFIAIYCGDDPDHSRLAREANQLAKMPLEDRRKILRRILVKPLNLEAWK